MTTMIGCIVVLTACLPYKAMPLGPLPDRVSPAVQPLTASDMLTLYDSQLSLLAPMTADSLSASNIQLLASPLVRESRAAPSSDPTASTLQAALALALARDPDIGIELSRYRQARHGVSIAQAAQKPRLDIVGSAGPNFQSKRDSGDTLALAREATLTLRQPIFDAGKRRADIDRSLAEADAADYAYEARIEATVLDVASAYLGFLKAETLLELAQQNQSEHERLLVLVQSSLELGFSSQADFSRVEARLAEARSLVFDQLTAKDRASQQFEQLVGLEPQDLRMPDVPVDSLPETAASALVELLANNPDLRRLGAERQVAIDESRAHQSRFKPAFDLQLESSLANDTSGLNGVEQDVRGLVSMTYNIYAGGADEARARQLHERESETALAFEKERRELEQRLADRYSALAATYNKTENLDQGLSASEAVASLYLQQFKAGRINVFELLDSQVELYGARREVIENEFTEIEITFGILADLGRLKAALIPW